MNVNRLLLVLLCLALSVAASRAADFTARQVIKSLADVAPGSAPDFSGKDLTYLDLAGLDFKSGNLSGASFFGTDLSDAKLARVDLRGANLDRTQLARADLTDANLEGASLFAIAGHDSGVFRLSDAPNFTNANLKKTHIVARLDGANFTGAKLDGAKIGEKRPSYLSHQPKVIMNYARFTNASLVGTDMARVKLQFATLDGADFTNANLKDCDFTKADLRGANFTGANITGADFYNANLVGVKGLDQAPGAETALNLDKAIR